MSADRVPVEGITMDPTPNKHGNFDLIGPSGRWLWSFSAGQLVGLGIPIPDPPFVDPLGIGLTKAQCDYFVSIANVYADGRDGRVVVGRALIAKGYTPEADR